MVAVSAEKFWVVTICHGHIRRFKKEHLARRYLKQCDNFGCVVNLRACPTPRKGLHGIHPPGNKVSGVLATVAKKVGRGDDGSQDTAPF